MHSIHSLYTTLYPLFTLTQRARALAESGPVFSSFTPQSILRSSLRPTPIATPTASPARSATPTLRPKESRITFMEESKSLDLPKCSALLWSNEVKHQSHSHTLSDTLTRSCSLARTHTLSRSCSLARAHTHSHTLTRTTRTHSDTFTHTFSHTLTH